MKTTDPITTITAQSLAIAAARHRGSDDVVLHVHQYDTEAEALTHDPDEHRVADAVVRIARSEVEGRGLSHTIAVIEETALEATPWSAQLVDCGELEQRARETHWYATVSYVETDVDTLDDYIDDIDFAWRTSRGC